MKKIGAKAQKWLKAFHIFFASLWVGGALSITLMQFFLSAGDGMQLYGINLSIKFIDDFIIIPGAIGLFLTGIMYSSLTGWGWFKHNWITVKWIINFFGVIFGTFWLGPWVNSLPPIAREEGIKALSNPQYINNKAMLYWFGTFQACTIVFALFVSIFKPWKKKNI